MRRFVMPFLVMVAMLTAGFGVGVFSAAFAPQRAALAQEATPDATPVAVPAFLQRLIDAINAGDGAAVAALYTEDGVYEDVQSGTVAHGRQQIADFIEKSAAIFTDVEMRPVAVHEGDGWAVHQYVYSATDASSGVRLEIRGATVFELDGELIRHSTDYYALPTAKQQG